MYIHMSLPSDLIVFHTFIHVPLQPLLKFSSCYIHPTMNKNMLTSQLTEQQLCWNWKWLSLTTPCKVFVTDFLIASDKEMRNPYKINTILNFFCVKIDSSNRSPWLTPLQLSKYSGWPLWVTCSQTAQDASILLPYSDCSCSKHFSSKCLQVKIYFPSWKSFCKIA